MKDLKTKTENFTGHVTDYVETYLKLSVLKATDKAAGVASVSITSIIITMLAFFVVLFLSMGLGWWIGQQLDNMLAGFGIIAGFYGLLVIVLMALRKNVFLPFFRNFIIRLAYEQ